VPVVALPLRDRRLPEPELLRKLTLAEPGAPSSHQDVVAAAHTNTVSVSGTCRDLVAEMIGVSGGVEGIVLGR
jgi:hypothetical protein